MSLLNELIEAHGPVTGWAGVVRLLVERSEGGELPQECSAMTEMRAICLMGLSWPDLSLFQHLTSLELIGKPFYDKTVAPEKVTLDHISGMPLTILQISHFSLGPLTREHFPNTIRVLSLDNCGLSSLPDLSDTNLRAVKISNNKFTEIPEWITKSKVRTLVVTNNRITTVSPLLADSNLTNLQGIEANPIDLATINLDIFEIMDTDDCKRLTRRLQEEVLELRARNSEWDSLLITLLARQPKPF